MMHADIVPAETIAAAAAKCSGGIAVCLKERCLYRDKQYEEHLNAIFYWVNSFKAHS